MPTQVNPLGSLVAGVLQTLQVSTKPPSTSSDTPNPVKAADAQVQQPDGRSIGASDASSRSLDEAVAKIQAFFQNAQSDLKFSVDKETGSIVFKIINASTREVVRQVPTEEVLSMARKLRELSHASDASGVLMDEKG